MKKLAKWGWLLSFLLVALAQPASAATAKTVPVKVTFVGAELVDNDHVGNEWYTVAYVNGKAIREGATVTLKLKPTASIQLKAYAEEQDKVPDQAAKTASVTVSSLTAKGTTKSLTVTVVENRGRYSGHKANWKFTFKMSKS